MFEKDSQKKKLFSEHIQVEINCRVIVEQISNDNNPTIIRDNYEAGIQK